MVEEPSGGWNLIVVDNGSTDQTREVIRRYERRLALTYLFEPNLGKNVALNRGLLNVAGDLVVFTDDDAFPHKDWLVQMRSIADAHADYAIFAGCIVPRWERHPEPWILSTVPLGVAFTISDARVAEGPTPAHNVFGPNMAVRADIFAHGYRFDTQIGPRGASYAMGSETEFVRRLMKLGFRAWYCQDAIVEHLIPAAHLRTSWILSRAIRFGRGQYRITKHDEKQAFPSWLGVPRFLFRQMCIEQARLLVALFRVDRANLFRSRWEFNRLWGQAVEAWLMRNEMHVSPESRCRSKYWHARR